jgi:hypothetical protein
MNGEKEIAKRTKVWFPEQEKILKTWGEASACYRYMNYRAFLLYKKASMRFTLPVIVLSTITGTANFAQEQFPMGIRPMVPSIIGGMNLIAGLIATIMQFLKINELMESHRVASMQYGKLSRTIRLELSLPLSERSMDGRDMLELCRAEYDRLIEQSPSLPSVVLTQFDLEFKDKKIFKPEIMHIQPIDPYQAIISNASKVKKMFGDENKMKKELTETFAFTRGETKTVKDELEDLKKGGFVSLQGKVMQDLKKKTEYMMSSGSELKEVVTEEPKEG